MKGSQGFDEDSCLLHQQPDESQRSGEVMEGDSEKRPRVGCTRNAGEGQSEREPRHRDA